MVDGPRSGETRPDFQTLYAEAFQRFGASALWNKARLEHPDADHALVIAHALRVDGDRRARQLAEDIEDAVRASASNASTIERTLDAAQ